MINFIVNSEKCSKCRQCVKECPSEIIQMEKDIPFIPQDKEKECIKCQHCLAVCPGGAISILGFDPENSIEINAGFPDPGEMEFLIKGRRSTRRFKKENIDAKEVSKLINAASYAPTGCNAMSIHFTLIDEYKKMARFRELALDQLRIVVSEKKLPRGFEFFEGIMKKWDDDKIDVIFRDAPHLIIASCPKDCVTPVEDSIIALTNFELLANSMGLGTLWVGLVKWLITELAPDLKKVLNIPENHIVGYAMLFGKPAVKFYRTIQRKPETINIPNIN